MPTILPERRNQPKPLTLPPGTPRGRSLRALIGLAVFSLAMIWLTPVETYWALKYMRESPPEGALIAALRFHSIEFTPAVGLVAAALCLYSFYYHRTAHLYILGGIWTTFGVWLGALYLLAC